VYILSKATTPAGQDQRHSFAKMIAANAPAPASASAPAPAPSASATSAQHSPLSVVVILPDSLSACAPEQRFVAAALQLQGSLSADSSPNLRSNGFPSADEHGRRLSLAPGLGAGLRVAPILDSSATVPTATIPPTAPSPPRHSDSLPLLPVTVRHSATRASFQAGDSLAMASAALQHPRGSLSGAAPAVRRAAAVADELVDFLRQGGLEGEFGSWLGFWFCLQYGVPAYLLRKPQPPTPSLSLPPRVCSAVPMFLEQPACHSHPERQ
jgi:hypothetical protein